MNTTKQLQQGAEFETDDTKSGFFQLGDVQLALVGGGMGNELFG